MDLNQAYDFNYQQFVPFTEQIHILPGDTFIVDCGLDSSDRSEMTYGGEKTTEEMCMTFLYVYPKVTLSACSSYFSWTDLLFFLYQASQYGFYTGFSWDLQNISSGFYDVTVPGAVEFYHYFQIGNITGNFDGFPGLELSDPQQRVQFCTGPSGQPLDGTNMEEVIPIPDRDYAEYDLDDYYVCQEDASSSSFEWEWDAWYVYVGAGAVALILLAVAALAIGKCTRNSQKSNEWYQRQENGYGAQDDTQKISLH